jgi:hypothetical protein
MIVSYTWGQDSSRLGAFYTSEGARDFITNVTVRQLAAMNNVSETYLHEQLVATHLWDWYAHGWSAGAFAMSGPNEFSTVMPSLLKLAYHGRVSQGDDTNVVTFSHCFGPSPFSPDLGVRGRHVRFY